MKVRTIAIIVILLFVLVAISMYVLYNNYMSDKISSSKLVNLEKFSWYEYNINYVRTGNDSVSEERYRFEWNNELYEGNLSKHYRETLTFIDINGSNFTHFGDIYWDIAGTRVIGEPYQDFENSVLIKSGRTNDNLSYKKFIPNMPANANLELLENGAATFQNTTYACKKYYLPSHADNGKMYYDRIIYWFNESIPVPVKISFQNDNTTYELLGWG